MSDFSTVLVEDPRLQLTDKVEFSVYKGASVIAPTEFPVIGSASNTSQQFTVTVPSLENLVDRCIIYESTVELTFNPTGNNTTGAAATFLQLGTQDAFQAFPLHSLITTMSCQINSTQVNINLQDMLPQLLTMVSREELAKWNDMTPTYIDNYANFNDAVGKNNNPLGAYGAGVDPCYMPRGAWYIDAVTNAPVANDLAWPVCKVKATFREPLLISPLLFGLVGPALQGINQFQFQINLDSTCSRVWSHADATARPISSISAQFFDPKMYVNFLTPSPYQLAKFNPRNVVDYYVLDRYVTTFNTPVPANGLPVQLPASSSIQIATIPDKAIICVRDSNSNLSSTVPNWFATINKCSVNFNAKQNILANASQQLLHRMSVEAGSVQSWLEFSGRAMSYDPTSKVYQKVGTTGSVLCLNFGEHIEQPEMYLAPASAGQFNLQFNLTVTNNGTEPINNPTLIVILMTSGVFSTEKGQSQTFVSLLNKDGVMAVLDEAPVSSDKLKRLVGGSWLSSLVRVGKVLAPALAPMAKDLLKSTGNKYANAGADLIGALGYGRSAGGMSAGGRSAGALKGHLM